jgi:hypothetical protein
MAIKFNSFYKPFLEKDEHKKSREYKKLSPKMKSAVAGVFKIMDAKPQDFILGDNFLYSLDFLCSSFSKKGL